MHRPPGLRYGVGVASSAIALGLDALVVPLIQASPFPISLAAMMVSTWFGGLGPGLLTTILTTLGTASFFLPPGHFEMTSPGGVARLGLVVTSALLVVGLGAALRAAVGRAEATARELGRREGETREHERRLDAVLEAARDYAISMLDADGRILSWSSGAEAITGHGAAEVVGQPLIVVDTPDDPGGRQPEDALRIAAETGRCEDRGWKRRRDGTRFWADGVITAIRDGEGRLRGYARVVRDATDRQRADETLRASEARFRILLDLAPDGILLVDRRGQIRLVNTQAQRIFGYGQGELMGQSIEVLVPERLQGAHARHRANFHAAPRTRPMGVGLSLEGRRKDGTAVPVEISLSPVDLEDGSAAIAIIRDTTDRVRTEARIQGLNQDLEGRVAELAAVNRELEAFSYSVSHDLRAPLRSIDGFSQALLEDCAGQLDLTGQDHLRRIRAAARRMGELIDDLLDLSRVTRREMRREPVLLSALAKAVITHLQRQEPERRVEVVIEDGLVASGDPHLLRLVLENLLGNAWKFTGKTAAARIEFGAVERGGTLVYFVRDNGVGFDMQYAHKLFGAFQRLHASTEFPGTGIGLATVQRVINRHGGRVWTEAAVGRGATFFFTLSMP